MCIIRFDWLIALYLFTPSPCNTSFLIVKNSGVREEVSDVNKSLCKKHIFGVFALMHLTFALCTFPTDTLHFTYHPFNSPSMCAIDNLQRMRFGSLPTSSQESVKHKSTFLFTFQLCTIYGVNGTAKYIERC